MKNVKQIHAYCTRLSEMLVSSNPAMWLADYMLDNVQAECILESAVFEEKASVEMTQQRMAHDPHLQNFVN